jgi:hypothetical protein
MSRKFQCKAVSISLIEKEGRRLDCGPYMSGAIEARELLEKLSARKDQLRKLTRGGMAGIVNAGRINRLWVDDSQNGLRFLSSTDVLQADLSTLSFIAKSVANQNPLLLIEKNWTLITRSGSIGRMAYARSDMDGMACTEDVLRVIPDESAVRPGYLYAYLSTKFGVPLVVSGTYGSIITHLEPNHIADLPVPRLGNVEDSAHELVQQSAELLTQYQKNINEATRLFFESVGLEDITPEEWHKTGADVGFSTASGALSTLRALNFNPRFLSLCEKIKNRPWKRLAALCVPDSLKRGGRYRRIEAEPEHAYLMIGQKQIFSLRPEGRWIAKTGVDDEVIVNPGTTLIAGAGTLADSELYSRCEFVWGDAAKQAYSELFYRVQADEEVIPSGALYAFMRSETAFRMLRSISFGSKLQYPHPLYLPNLPVPYPPKEIRDRTHELVIRGYEMREKAVQFEDEAKAIVERAIEDGAR